MNEAEALTWLEHSSQIAALLTSFGTFIGVMVGAFITILNWRASRVAARERRTIREKLMELSVQTDGLISQLTTKSTEAAVSAGRELGRRDAQVRTDALKTAVREEVKHGVEDAVRKLAGPKDS